MFSAAATGVLLFLLLALSTMTTTVGAIVAVIAAVLLLAMATLGLGRTAEVLVILGVFLAPMNDLHTSGSLSFVTAADAVFVVGFVLMVPDLLRKPLQLPPAFVLGLGGVFSVALMSSFVSENPGASFNSMARLLVGAFGLMVLIAWWNPGLPKVVALASAYVAGNAVSVLYALSGAGAVVGGRQLGITEHPNIFGLCALLGVALIPFLLAETPREFRWLPAVGGVLCLVGIWTSGSRGALASMLAVGLVFPLLSRSIPAALALLSSFAAFMAFSNQILGESSSSNALGRLLGHGSSGGSDLAREQLAARAIDQFQAHPVLGVGLVDVLAAHVIYLQIAAGLGAIGLGFYIIVLWTMIRPAVLLSPPFNLLALPALAYVMVGFVTPVLWDRYIWAALALSLLAPRLAAVARDEAPEADRHEGGLSDGSAQADAPHR